MANLQLHRDPIEQHTSTSPSIPSHIYALIVGINVYSSDEYDNLKAAVGDANAFEGFLVDSLQVPPQQIISLRNEEATRDGILEGFSRLHRISTNQDDPALIIFYAGHGARVHKPQNWTDWATTSDQIEILCPSDLGCVIRDPSGQDRVIEGISDRTVSLLLNNLSDLKGNNITLILDCCCSAGMNRGDDDCIPRQILNPPLLSPHCDDDITSCMGSARGTTVSPGFSSKFQASHVLLAACGREQVAFEKAGQGIFTRSLLNVLKSNEIASLTYSSLMHKLDMPQWQTPHCEGESVNRLLFDRESVGGDPRFILVKRGKDETGTFTNVLQAGSAQGICLGSRFSIHNTNLLEQEDRHNPSMGQLIVIAVDPFTSTLQLLEGSAKFKLSKIFYAQLLVHSQQQTTTIYSQDQEWLKNMFPSADQTDLSVRITDDPEQADLLLTVEDDSIYFDRNDVLVEPHIGRRFPHSIGVDAKRTLHEVVACWRRFNDHLTRLGPDEFADVRMELRYLKEPEAHSLEFESSLVPLGSNLIQEEPAVIIVDDSMGLGMNIINQTDTPLYPYLFYFDPSDLTITKWFTPAEGTAKSAAGLDVPLPPKSELPIGYGGGGASPWEFVFRPDETVDLGFFKLFLSTSPANFSSIVQTSPFEATLSRSGKAEKIDAVHWGTKLATIVQHCQPKA